MSGYAQYQARLSAINAETSRVERVAAQLNCSHEDAQTYLDLRDEGYSQHQAKVMAGLADPS